MTTKDDLAIAEHLALRGVTKCPTVCLNKTQATIKTDTKALKRHQEMQNALKDARFKRMYYGRSIFFLLGFNFIPAFRVLESLLGI